MIEFLRAEIQDAWLVKLLVVSGGFGCCAQNVQEIVCK